MDDPEIWNAIHRMAVVLEKFGGRPGEYATTEKQFGLIPNKYYLLPIDYKPVLEEVQTWVAKLVEGEEKTKIDLIKDNIKLTLEHLVKKEKAEEDAKKSKKDFQTNLDLLRSLLNVYKNDHSDDTDVPDV
jgi:hypothetical protein